MYARSLGMLILFTAGAAAAEPQPLEQALLQKSIEVIKYCEENKFQNVAVLKFQIRKDGQTWTDKAGTLNMFLARRLEVALFLKNNPRKPIGIIDNASAVAQRTKGASHLTPEGKATLLNTSYPLAWGKEEVKPDVVITGRAEVSRDLKTLSIQLITFNKNSHRLEPLGDEFVVANQPELLVELGESFNTRGFVDDGETKIVKFEKTLRNAELVKHEAKDGQYAPKNPANDNKAPVTLEVRYDGRVVPIEVRGGKAYVPEPRQGQKVAFWLKSDDTERFALVLKVNGENTIERQRLPDLQCRYWVLEPRQGPIVIDGYLKANNREKEEFRVLSTRESQEREMDYGADVGTITLTVFREWKGTRPPPAMNEEAKEALLVHKGTLETMPQDGEPQKPDNPGAQRARLMDGLPRGIIAEGPTKPGAVNLVKFEADPLPVMCLTVVYYNPRTLPK